MTAPSPTSVPDRDHPALNAAVSLAAVATAVALAPEPLVGLAVAGTIAALVEVLWPLHDRRRTRAALLTDLTHAVGNRYLVIVLFVLVLALTGPVAAALVPAPVREAVGAWPAPARLAVVFVLTDLANYLGHVALHRVPALWRLHAVHHSSEHLDWLATARVHPLDLALSTAAAALPAYALGLGLDSPWLLTFLFLYPFVTHANARVRIPVLDRVLVSPEFHHWHHAEDPAAHDRNFGAALAVWDRLFGTTHEPGGFPARYGIGDPALAGADYAGHLASPFRRRRRMPARSGAPERR
jgi:sterol desaturase/sphingolipid hydroxylase (fatty acid hydroxylase superfamily)